MDLKQLWFKLLEVCVILFEGQTLEVVQSAQ